MDDKTTTTDAAAAPAPAPAPAPPPASADDKAKAAKAAAVDALVASYVDTLRDGPVARDTPAWNAFTASLPALKAAILKNGG